MLHKLNIKAEKALINAAFRGQILFNFGKNLWGRSYLENRSLCSIFDTLTFNCVLNRIFEAN